MEKILIVVDIQKAYSPHFSKDYVKSVQNYIESNRWNNVIVRFVGESEYSVIHHEKILHTFYNDSRHIPQFLNKEEYLFSERWFGYEMEGSDEVIEIVKDKLYKVRQDGEWWLMSETPNGDMYCPCRVMENLLNKNAEIHVIGGFRDQCVKEVYDFLKWAGLKNIVVQEEYCFIEKEPNIEESLKFTSDWVVPNHYL